MVERRRLQRKKVKDAFIEYQKTSLLSFLKKEQGKKLPLLNITIEGLQFLALESTKTHSKYNLTISAPGLIKPLNASGKVMWTKKVRGRKDAYRVGVKFTKIGKSEKEQIMSLKDKSDLEWTDEKDFR